MRLAHLNGCVSAGCRDQVTSGPPIDLTAAFSSPFPGYFTNFGDCGGDCSPFTGTFPVFRLRVRLRLSCLIFFL
jgi:hypothetical protein